MGFSYGINCKSQVPGMKLRLPTLADEVNDELKNSFLDVEKYYPKLEDMEKTTMPDVTQPTPPVTDQNTSYSEEPYYKQQQQMPNEGYIDHTYSEQPYQTYQQQGYYPSPNQGYQQGQQPQTYRDFYLNHYLHDENCEQPKAGPHLVHPSLFCKPVKKAEIELDDSDQMYEPKFCKPYPYNEDICDTPKISTSIPEVEYYTGYELKKSKDEPSVMDTSSTLGKIFDLPKESAKEIKVDLREEVRKYTQIKKKTKKTSDDSFDLLDKF